MPIETSYVPEHYDGNDVDTSFVFEWRILQKSDLVVKVVTVATGAVVDLVLDTDYTIADEWVDNEDGGEIETTDPVATGDRIWLIRDTSKTQLVNILEGSPFPAATVTKVFDRLTMMIQELVEEVLIGAELPVTETDTTKAVIFEETQANADYEIVAISPNWLTTYAWGTKTVNGFTITFSDAAPADAKVVYRIKAV